MKLNKFIIVAVLIMFICLWLMVEYACAEILTASWYSVQSLKDEGTFKYSKGVMANGKKFNDLAFTAASWDYPLGTTVKVTNIKTGASVQVMVTDRTARRFKGKRIDLTPIAFKAISGKWGLEEGLVKVRVEVIK